jgi:hypothetical protein
MTRNPGQLSLVLLCATTVACGDDDAAPSADAAPTDAATPDAGPPPATVFEHMAAGGWITDFRERPGDCADCRRVFRWEMHPNAECGCIELTLHGYYDVAPTDPVVAMGAVDGDERCATNAELIEQPFADLDPLKRSVVKLTITQSTCGDPVGGVVYGIFDALSVDASGAPGLVSAFFIGAPEPFAAWPGWPVMLGQVSAIPLAPCAEADHVAGRDYCMPSCDFPGADPGRTTCGFPDYEPPFAACNTLTQIATPVQPQQVAEALPAPTGGAIPDGTYVITAITVYTGVGGATGPITDPQALTSVNTGGVAQTVFTVTGQPDSNETYTYVANGTGLTVAKTCRGTGATDFDAFSQTADGYIIYNTSQQAAFTYTVVP